MVKAKAVADEDSVADDTRFHFQLIVFVAAAVVLGFLDLANCASFEVYKYQDRRASTGLCQSVCR